MSIVLTDREAQEKAEADLLPKEVPPIDVRVAAMEQALKFTMENIPVHITLPSPLVGVPPQVLNTNLYQVYLDRLAQARAAQERQQANNG